jgi:ATP/maltotriose-dependent transcriptional regulator MalT/DNA-binding SARP family transcriptional activator
MVKRTAPAKTSPPRLFGVVARERLFALLDANHGRPLVWICGPPGAGKTTLVASYLEHRERPTLWYQIDAGDADPAALFHYLTLAARAHGGADPAALPRFVPEHQADLPGFARLYFRALFSNLPSAAVLVLDNYQEAPAAAPLHAMLRASIAEVPRDSSVVAISRTDSPRDFVQLSAGGAMETIGWDALRLSVDEVRAIAARRNVTDEWLVEALHRQSEGWAAGITLMLERLGHPESNVQDLPAHTREGVFNYFASLIFDALPEAARASLLSLAHLPRVTPALARELSGSPDAPLLLEELYRRRMFIDRRPGEPEPVYQFHALFLDFLRARARVTLTRDALDELRHRSACAVEGAGDIDAAMALWLDQANWERAIRLVLQEAGRVLASGRRQTLVSWLQRIPDAEQVGEPWVVCWLGRAQLQISPSEGLETLERALGLFRSRGDLRGQVECLTDLISGAFVGFEALDSADGWLDELLGRIDLSSASLPADVSLRSWGVLCMALFHLRPWHPLTAPAYRQVERLLPRSQDASVALGAASAALIVSYLSGDFAAGDRVAAATESVAAARAASPADAAWWFAQVGYLRYVEARYEEAHALFGQAFEIAKANGLRALIEVVLLWRVMQEFRVLGWPAAAATLTEVELLPASERPMTRAMVALFRARHASFLGDGQQAVELAFASERAVTRTGSQIEVLIYAICLADLLAEAGHCDGAVAQLSRSRELIERAPGYDCWRGAQLLVEAWLAHCEGDAARALATLRDALAAAKSGMRRYYLRFPDRALVPLFGLALEHGIEVDLVQSLIRLFRLKAPVDAPDSWPWPVRIATLGRFEVQVDGKALEFSRKLPRKTLLLLKALVALGGRDVPEQTLCDALWSDEEGDAAANALAITVVRLRKLLGSSEAVAHQGGKVSLNPELCWVDAWVFEKRAAQASSAAQALDLYAGTFLPQDEGEPWSVATRERLRGKFIHALSACGAQLESSGEVDRALACYQRGIDADPIVEGFYEGLMRCYERLGQRAQALSAYRRLKHMLSVLLGVPPAESTRRLFEQMLRRQAQEAGVEEGPRVTPIGVARVRRDR